MATNRTPFFRTALICSVFAVPALAAECTQLDAADPTVPNVFTSGAPAVAADVNANFDCLADELGPIQKAITPDTNGNIGIGTTSPATKLDVAGAISVNGVEVIDTNGALVNTQGLSLAACMGIVGNAFPSPSTQQNLTLVATNGGHGEGACSSIGSTCAASLSGFGHGDTGGTIWRCDRNIGTALACCHSPL